MHSIYKRILLLFIIISSILMLLSCDTDKASVNRDISGSIKNIYYDEDFTNTHFIAREYDLERPKYYRPHSEDEDEYYFSENVYEYIKSNKENYICYNVEVTISNNGKCNIYGYKFELAKDYGASVVIYDVFPIEAFEIWEPGETYDVSIPIFVDKTKFSENDINNFLNNLSLLFTYESVDYPTQAIDDFFGWIPESRCIGVNTITIN